MFALLITPFDTSVRVTQQDLHAFYATEVGLIGLLNACSSGVVALCVIGIVLDVFAIDLANVY